jgi:hypothetical protein
MGRVIPSARLFTGPHDNSCLLMTFAHCPREADNTMSRRSRNNAPSCKNSRPLADFCPREQSLVAEIPFKPTAYLVKPWFMLIASTPL